MGFSLSAAAAIIGISILISVEIFIGTLLPTTTNLYDSYKEMKERIINQIQTDISIIGVATSSNGSNYDLNITLENTGSISLETRYFNVLINGTNKQFSCLKTNLYPNEEIYFNVTNLSGIGEKKIKIITNNGISDHYEYMI
jgi:archaellum component FlaF (FlaF/FlaG flagellin family)